MAIGASIGAWVGSAIVAAGASAAAGAVVAGVVAGAIKFAIIGAVVGGLGAAVTGGDIMKGVLYGAIGGAVTGGIAGGFSALGSTATTGVSQVAGQTAAHSTSALNVGGQAANHTSNMTAIAAGAASGSGGSSISAMLSDIGKEVGAEAIKTGIGGYMANEAQEDMLKAQKEESALAHERNLEEMRLAAELAEGGKGSAQAVDNTGAELAYNARMAELDQRKDEFDTQTSQTRKEWDTEMDRRSQRRALFSGGADSAGPEVSEGTPNGGSLIEKRQDNVEVAPTSALSGSTAEEI